MQFACDGMQAAILYHANQNQYAHAFFDLLGGSLLGLLRGMCAGCQSR